MKKALIVVDYQKDFVDGSLGFSGAENLDNGICECIERYRASGGDVIFTFDTHGEDYLQTAEGKALPIVHCINDCEGHKLYGKTAQCVHDNDKIVLKQAYGSLELGNYLDQMGYDEVLLCGLVSNICVLSNAVIARAALPMAEIIVDAYLTDSLNRELHSKSLDVLEGINVKIINR